MEFDRNAGQKRRVSETPESQRRAEGRIDWQHREITYKGEATIGAAFLDDFFWPE